jgi:hypothetical protein
MMDSSETSSVGEQLARILEAEISKSIDDEILAYYRYHFEGRSKSPFRMTRVKIRECQHTR